MLIEIVPRFVENYFVIIFKLECFYFLFHLIVWLLQDVCVFFNFIYIIEAILSWFSYCLLHTFNSVN